MKSPAELAAKLAKNWQSADFRIARLLHAEGWPLVLPIGKPSPKVFAEEIALVRQHVQRWREVGIGRVDWQRVVYRAGDTPVQLPLHWELSSPSDWVAATGDAAIQTEYEQMAHLIGSVDPIFHSLLLRLRRFALGRPADEVIRASRVALSLEPGCAKGRPLRALTVCNVDSKFIERNRRLLIEMLDARFEGQVSDAGLEAFLDAEEDTDQWLLVAPLAPGLLPFQRQRVPVSELHYLPDSVSHIILVENERCLHQLPSLVGAVAILGAGLNLGWTAAKWLARRHVAYWGDMDTWGLMMLSRVRQSLPDVTAVLMDRSCFDRYAVDSAVLEPVSAGIRTPDGLTDTEAQFYQYLLQHRTGRIEQEFLPEDLVSTALSSWHGVTLVRSKDV
ncbi:DUF2220 family protein [Cupriavidus gilardii]|uniref:DUF2220 family protein n=1 Tax=Cupriavidus gilardii TaxID=82541 RepID=A0ABY4VJ78_9BURK|nr:Wadjet anti-phage system protein JetD domain-containing protein [Cupriavidus gilardii]USE77281.1 DUF2220 family protein [Cupriavidus gilardii]